MKAVDKSFGATMDSVNDSHQEEAKKPPHRVLVLDPVCPAVDGTVRELQKDPENVIERYVDAAALAAAFGKSTPCLLYLSIRNKADILRCRALLTDIHDVLELDQAKVIALSALENPRIDDALRTMGCTDVLPIRTAVQTLAFKSKLYLRTLRANYQAQRFKVELESKKDAALDDRSDYYVISKEAEKEGKDYVFETSGGESKDYAFENPAEQSMEWSDLDREVSESLAGLEQETPAATATPVLTEAIQMPVLESAELYIPELSADFKLDPAELTATEGEAPAFDLAGAMAQAGIAEIRPEEAEPVSVSGNAAEMEAEESAAEIEVETSTLPPIETETEIETDAVIETDRALEAFPFEKVTVLATATLTAVPSSPPPTDVNFRGYLLQLPNRLNHVGELLGSYIQALRRVGKMTRSSDGLLISVGASGEILSVHQWAAPGADPARASLNASEEWVSFIRDLSEPRQFKVGNDIICLTPIREFSVDTEGGKSRGVLVLRRPARLKFYNSDELSLMGAFVREITAVSDQLRRAG